MVIALLILVFHLDVSPDLPIAGVSSELPLGLVIAAGLAGGVERGAYFGFVFGFVIDLFFFTPIGLRALVFGAIGWVAGHVFLDRIEESPVTAAVAIGGGTALAQKSYSDRLGPT